LTHAALFTGSPGLDQALPPIVSSTSTPLPQPLNNGTTPLSLAYQNPLPVPLLSQNNDTWRADRQGWCDPGYPNACDYSTLGYLDNSHLGYGCWTTSYAMLYNYYQSNYTDPRDLNDKLNTGPSGGPRYGNCAGNHCNNCMPGGSPYAPAGVSRGTQHYNVCAEPNCIDPANVTIIDNEINAGRPLLAYVHFSGIYPQHMIVITGHSGNTYYVNDPWDGGQHTLASGSLGAYVVDYIYQWNGTPPAGGACSAPSLIEPSDGAVLSSQTITFRWNAVSGCTFNGYTFRVCTSPDVDNLSNCFIDTGEGSTQRTETITGRDYQDLYWGVRAANAPGGANWAVRRFRIEPGGTNCPQSGGVILYWNSNYNCDNNEGDSGYRQRTSTGWQNVTDGQFNDKASSVRVPSGWSVRLFENADRGEPSVCYNTDIVDFGTQGNFPGSSTPINDHVSSMEVFSDDSCNASVDNAAFTDQSPYPTVDAGQQFSVFFEVRNTGNTTWRDSDGYGFENINDQPLGAWPRQEIGGDISPGATKRWDIQMTAPSQPGVYRTQWMLKHWDQTFGPNMFIDVTVPDVGPLVFEGQAVDDDNSDQSNGDGDGVAECGETVELYVTLRNQGNGTTTGVNATISTGDSYISWLYNTNSGYPDISGGGTGTNSNDFDFSIDSSTPDGHVIYFDLDISASNGGPWSDSFELPVSCCGDVYEPNHETSHATSLAYGETKAANICPAGDEDFFQFTGQSGDQIVIDIDARVDGSTLDSYIYLIDSDGTTVLAQNDDAAGSVDSKLGYHLPHDGTYYIEVREYSHPSEGGHDYFYTIHLIVDDTSPTAEITSPASDTWLDPNLQTITTNVNDNESGIRHVTFYWHDADWDNSDWIVLYDDRYPDDGWTYDFDTSAIPEQPQDCSVFIYAYDWGSNYIGYGSYHLGIDRTPPGGSIRINDGAAYANSTAVTLNLNGTDVGAGVGQVMASNHDDFGGATWVAYADSLDWTLTSGDGVKRVYVRFRDHAGNESSGYSDTIVLDTTPPTGSILIEGGAEVVTAPQLALILSASDAHSVTHMRLRNDAAAWSAWEPFAASRSWTLPGQPGEHTVWVQFRDAAGNLSVAYSDAVVYEYPYRIHLPLVMRHR